MRKTKVICTLGPASSELKILKEMMESGMDVARLNMSHGTHDNHQEKIDIIKALREKLGRPVSIMIDTKGPEIRVKQFSDGRVFLNKNRMFTLTTSDIIGSDKMVSVTYKKLPQILHEGDPILISDGLIELKVVSTTKYDVLCKIIEGGELSNNKSINLPKNHVEMPYMSDIDKSDILFAIENDVDYIAISFVRTPDDVAEVKKFIELNGGKNVKIISKIENQEGIDNIEEIIKNSDGVMVARGDLGVEVDFKKIPTYQKKIIKLCNKYGKTSITATQMLESMISNFRPTRAEISDVANAVLDGTSAVMLSGETAVGAFVCKTISTMCEIIEECEDNFHKKIAKEVEMDIDDVSEDIAFAATTLSHNSKIDAIASLTLSGKSTNELSVFKPNCTIFGCTPNKKVFNQLAMNWGVVPVLVDYEDSSIDELISATKNELVSHRFVKKGDTIIFTASLPFGKSVSTNVLQINVI